MTSGAGESTQTSGPPRILIVDDEPLLGEALVRLLTRSGYDAHVAFTAEHAEFVASGKPFDCAIIDVVLGPDDGVELACELLRNGRVRKVVFYTGLLDDDTLDRATRVGVCVDKAACYDELASAVEAAIGDATTEAPARQHPLPPPSPASGARTSSPSASATRSGSSRRGPRRSPA